MGKVMIDGKEYAPVTEEVNTENICLIRTHSAGVHFGHMVWRSGKEVKLKNARRLWSWSGACSLSQVAVDGVDLEGSRISVPVPEITLTEAIEIIPMTKKAADHMMGAKSWKK